jgi:hypothetical protein
VLARLEAELPDMVRKAAIRLAAKLGASIPPSELVNFL